MHNRKQGRVYEQGLRITHKLGYDRVPQGFQETPQLTQAATERRRGSFVVPALALGVAVALIVAALAVWDTLAYRGGVHFPRDVTK
jgi:ferric-dicitrate binding protein FerR (iron transport regulator)